MKHRQSKVLIVEHDQSLLALNDLILSEDGNEVRRASLTRDIVSQVKEEHPDVVVVGVRPNYPDDWRTVDGLYADTATASIPLVVISTAARTAVEALAAPNVRETVVAPYDITALQHAVANAVGQPPAAATLPSAPHPAAEDVVHTIDVLNTHSRSIILQAIQELQQIEPYRSRFPELSPGLIDDLPMVFGAVVGAVHRGLAVSQFAADAEVRRTIEQHERLRQKQGISPVSVVREYQTLRADTFDFLRSQIAHGTITATDAFTTAQQIALLFDEVVRLTVRAFFEQSRRGQKRAAT